ncbi:hypothetical protein BG015_005272 [Linnemannia schmuckeri]|uniref:Uncharacterized protein n=1 Tax=Linnemannia schmuckeri TaxID=64567 RepID=A0A9P5R6D2_9FUNG|nr:hypothetical protein BG015_005272 [Linnemannia schmuckeri]
MEQPSHASSSSSSPSPSSPSLPPIDSKDEKILFLSRRLERMERLMEDRFDLVSHPAITTQAALQHYRPSEADIMGCPSIRPTKPVEFFTKQSSSDTELKEAIRGFPKNVHMDQYKAPKVPQIVSNNLNFNKKHDGQIREFQERCAELTRPVDFFYFQFRQLQEFDPELLDPQKILDLSVSFAVLMRNHLGGMAVKMHETRMSNVREAAGANFEDDPLNMFDPQTFHDHTKSVRTLQSYFKNKTGSDNRRDKGGYGNNNNNTQGNNGHSYNGHNNSDRNRSNNNQDRRSQSRSGRDYNSNNRSSSSFHRNSGHRRGNSQQRGRSSSRRDDRSPRSEGGSKDF